MRYIPRKLEKVLRRAVRQFPAILLTGARRTGKTTLLQRTFPNAAYVLLEDPDIIGRFRADPHGFLDSLRLPVILDEVQNVPDLLNYVRSRIDVRPRAMGQWLLTGSHEAPLMAGVSESMAGRAAILQLMPLSTEETPRVEILHGGFPEALAQPSAAGLWYASYVQTYLERDVRQVSSIRDLATFRRFLTLAATRCGTMLNRADLAAGLAVSVPTISQWLNILETTQQIILVPPFFENLGKRIVKSPRLYFADTGLLCHLLGINSRRELERSPFFGAVFENFVVSEVVKHQVNQGRRREVYYFRDRQGLEVDLLVPLGSKSMLLVETKSSRTVFPNDAAPLLRLCKAMKRYETTCLVVYQPTRDREAITALQPSVQAVSVKAMLKRLR
jgi:predicted AAA+ superfamily ATPase